MTYSSEAVGRRIQAQLLLRGFVQQDLANKLGISQAAVSRRLNGRASFSACDLAVIANWLDVSVSDFFEPLPEQRVLVEAVA
ncbi:helix-turn-helix domain-containing protein [Propionimicrobium lymphophilum]|uniref:helix-turn-helix domain-containing protein n=1 Tax=Propionimicrobium lymphophilum TaxID=33012 RepID=UPI00288AF9CE|nr:helix-turn-helix transcriptional regulator [Propionimicrobium lymphophilum]